MSIVDRAPTLLNHGLPSAFGQMPVFTQTGPTTLQALVTAPASWSGLGTIMHGGFQGLLLADILERVAKDLVSEGGALPRDLTLRYHRPVPVAIPICIWGYLVEDRGQVIETYGEIKDANDNLLTEAEGIFTRTELEDPPMPFNKNIPGHNLQPEFDSLRHWPAWSACCEGPLERASDLHIDWRLPSDRSALGGLLQLPAGLRQMPASGILAALFDQSMGLLGSQHGLGIMLTVRLQVTLSTTLPIDEPLTLLCHGSRLGNGSFKAQAWLQHKQACLAEANGNFSILNRGHGK